MIATLVRRRARAGALAVAGLLASGCGGPADPGIPAVPARVLLVGVDGLDWSVALPLLRAGRMPHLERLMRVGRFGRLETIAPGKSPVIWTSVATGRGADEHGILDFTLEDAGGTRLYTSADRRTKALWNVLSDAGRRTIVVSWWNTFPAEPIDGVVIAQANTLEQIARRRLLKPGGLVRGVEGQVHPATRQQEMLDLAAEVDASMPTLLRGIFGDIGRTDDLADRANLDACAWSVRADESTRRIALRLAAETPPPELFAVYFGTPDVVSHRFWRFHEPQAFDHPPPAGDVERFGRVVTDAYAHTDALIGELVAAMPRDATVVVLSDHGMHAANTFSRFDVPVDGRLERESGGHEDGPPGMFVAAGPGVRARHAPADVAGLRLDRLQSVGHVLDVAPTLLALLELPLGRDMRGEPLDRIFEIDPGGLRYVDSHDDAAWRASRKPEARRTPGLEERLEQLRSLGYLGDADPSEPPPEPRPVP